MHIGPSNALQRNPAPTSSGVRIVGSIGGHALGIKIPFFPRGARVRGGMIVGMKRFASLSAFVLSLVPFLAFAASAPTLPMKTAVVFVANYDDNGDFLGWGSGFYVDEGIVVTNRHVIEDGDYYRVYGTGADEKVNMECYKKITRSDVKLNLNDDVAYMRVYLPCDHGVLRFALDPEDGDRVSVLGYPYKGSVEASLTLTVTSGSVIGNTSEGWRRTDAFLDLGNSGGPVVNDTDVVGVAVAKGVDAEGKFVTGYFIQSSVILDGLLYANDPRFGYTPQSSFSSRSRSSSSVSSSSSKKSSSSSVTSRGSVSSRSLSSRSFSSRASAQPSPFPDVRVTHPAFDAIVSLYEEGVINGYPDGTFRPAGGINRAELIKIIMLGFHDQEILGETDCFADVRDEWFAPAVCAAKRLGWISGYADGTFRPDQLVNRAEAMKIVTEAFGAPTPRLTSMPPDVPGGSWFHPYVAKGILIGIADTDTPFRPGDNLTRAEAATWIDGANI